MTLWPAALRLLNRVRRFISDHPSSLDCTMRAAEARGSTLSKIEGRMLMRRKKFHAENSAEMLRRRSKEAAKDATVNGRPKEMEDSENGQIKVFILVPSMTALDSYLLGWLAH
jgi:hypothetical protein